MCDCECVIIAGQLSTTPTQQPIDLNPDVAYEGSTRTYTLYCSLLPISWENNEAYSVHENGNERATAEIPGKTYTYKQLRCMVRYRGEVQVAASYSASVYYCTIVQVLVSTYMWQTMHLHPFGCMTGNHCCMHSSAAIAAFTSYYSSK